MRISSLRDGNQLCAVNHVDLAGIVVTCKRARCKRYPGRVLPLCWVIWMCRHFDPLFWHSEDWTRSFWGIFSHPPTPKRSFGVLKLPILTEFDLLGPKFHLSLDLFGSKFQRPAAHPHQFSDRVPPPPGKRYHNEPSWWRSFSLDLIARLDQPISIFSR